MSRPISDYALIGDTETAALVARDGSVDWWCVPRFDGGACFAALLGSAEHGRWALRPAGELTRVERRYRPATMVLETELSTAAGTVRLIDFMPPRGRRTVRAIPDLVRIVEGVAGRVPVRMDLTVRFDYGWIVPWVTRVDGTTRLIAGPDGLVLATPVETRGEDLTTVAEVEVTAGDRVPFTLSWYDPSGDPPERLDPEVALETTVGWWEGWSAASTYDGGYTTEVQRSLITLKGLTHAPTGAMVAAPTASLPEELGGSRNWDYRYTWLRDATFTLYAMVAAGYDDEARAWRDWLLRTTAGDPGRLQIMYGLAGERRLTELELGWLPGYADSRPVRVGNAAHDQLQHDVYGEVLDVLHTALEHGMQVEQAGWELQRALMDRLEGRWRDPDNGLWEIRGAPRHFTHSKIMAWVAFDRAAATAEACGLDGPVDRWRRTAADIHREVCERGWDDDRGAFTQTYDGAELDAALLQIPQVGFLAHDDDRVAATIGAIERELVTDDVFVRRYDTASGVDGIAGHEGAFLLCSFWLVDALAMVGRGDEARARFERLCGLANDVGLLAEEYDPEAGRMLGNFPQAFSHVGLANSAATVSGASTRPSVDRSPDQPIRPG